MMKSLTKAISCAFLLFLFSGTGNLLKAQKPVLTDSVTNAFFPALAYNSDLGLVVGGLYSRYNYRQNERPFYSYLDASALISTKGLIQTSLFYDKPNALNSKLRITTDVYLSRFLQNQYYGVGNYQTLPDEPEGKPDYYLFRSFSTGFEFTLRYPLLSYQNENHLDVLSTLVFDYKTPWENDENRLMVEEQPLGYGGARTAALGVGLMWEGRNNEFAPIRGTYFKTTAEFGQNFFGSSYDYFRFESDIRTYISFFLIREITFANRLMATRTSGSVPYWKMAEVGGETTMRGFPERRFLDNNALLLNSELRTWLLIFPEQATRLGGVLFMDIGRTFSNSTPFDEIYNDLKYTFGFGGTGSFFTPDFILRGDVGFSDEGIGIYFTAGYLF